MFGAVVSASAPRRGAIQIPKHMGGDIKDEKQENKSDSFDGDNTVLFDSDAGKCAMGYSNPIDFQYSIGRFSFDQW